MGTDDKLNMLGLLTKGDRVKDGAPETGRDIWAQPQASNSSDLHNNPHFLCKHRHPREADHSERLRTASWRPNTLLRDAGAQTRERAGGA